MSEFTTLLKRFPEFQELAPLLSNEVAQVLKDSEIKSRRLQRIPTLKKYNAKLEKDKLDFKTCKTEQNQYYREDQAINQALSKALKLLEQEYARRQDILQTIKGRSSSH